MRIYRYNRATDVLSEVLSMDEDSAASFAAFNLSEPRLDRYNYFFDPDDLEDDTHNWYIVPDSSPVMFCYNIKQDILEIVQDNYHDNIAYFNPPLDEFAPKHIYFYANLDTTI